MAAAEAAELANVLAVEGELLDPVIAAVADEDDVVLAYGAGAGTVEFTGSGTGLAGGNLRGGAEVNHAYSLALVRGPLEAVGPTA